MEAKTQIAKEILNKKNTPGVISSLISSYTTESQNKNKHGTGTKKDT